MAKRPATELPGGDDRGRRKSVKICSLTHISSTVGFNGVDTPNVITYQGGASAETQIDSLEKSGGNVTLRWDSAEGGNYVVETSADLTDWTTIPQVPATGTAFQTERTVPAATPARSFHRIRSDGVAPYDVIDTP
jgi:hypothetical protein